ncbi:trypsin-like serine peptidase [Streptomyces sp. URMC 123]|uniref:trypsin-like serine peptidase n=1 Tax=Streptomyces sp. URMC 123 TaxID=3423403 RepID=UPI003F19624B
MPDVPDPHRSSARTRIAVRPPRPAPHPSRVASAEGVCVRRPHTLAAEQQRVRDFWTPERMRTATPFDRLVAQPRDRRGPAPSSEGGTTTVAPTGPAADAPPASRPSASSPTSSRSSRSAAFPQAGGPWTGGGAVVKTSGRVFFTFQGRTASCSGNAVTSRNASTVITAGHCLKYQGSWHTNWAFVPAYRDGQTPYGTWTATTTLATPQWADREEINFDIGAAVVGPVGGKKLTEVVGAQGLQFNGGYNKPMYAFGFPAAAPYDGTKLIHCSGNTTKDFLLTNDHAMGCNMTGGSSGGPWFASFDEATGTGLQTSVNSFGYTFLPNRMFGPYFGDDAKALYERAQATN